MSTQVNTENPFIQAHLKQGFGTRDEAVPFDTIKVEHFLPAAKYAYDLALKNIENIKNDTSPASFENTALALETSSELFSAVVGTYFNLFSAEGDEALQALAKDISPLDAQLSSEIALDEKLFKRVEELHSRINQLNLNAEQKRLVEKQYKDFARNGAKLEATKKARLKQIDQELAKLGPQFSENVLKSTNAFSMVLENKADLVGLPEGIIEAAAADAKAKGHEGKWLFNLQFPSYMPFMQYAQNRELRKKLHMAYASRSYKDNFDNQDIILQTVRLREERAQILGFKTYAEYVLEERMAQSSDKVWDFLKRLYLPSKKAAERDLQELKTFKKTIDGSDDLKPWDAPYLSEKLKEQKFKFNEEELRPYFKLENVVEGVFEHARRLYGITFKEIFDVPKYHDDVRTFEVREEKTQNYVGLFYTDFFPRETKKSGAWMTNYREQGLFLGKTRRPHVSIVCNFTKPTEHKPSLLTYDEVLTMFHEFGHALHGLLSNVQYRSLAGTNVYWDFVELPSQIMENWVKEKEGLDVFARHYQTGESIPAELVEKIKKANQFQTGMFSLRQLNFGMLDMHWHTTAAQDIKDVTEFENKATEMTRIFPAIEGTNSSCAFSHIFSGPGYAAGYYSYKWAEVLDADAFEFFKEKGLFNRELGESFKKHVLSRGGTEHPMDLYKQFRGREPDPNALLKRDGLLEA